jgi:hypothetical protein
MANQTNNRQGSNTGAMIGIGAGVAAAAAAAAGAYWLYGAKHSAQHRRMAKSWMLKARADVLDAVGKLQNIDKSKYMSIAQNIVDRYAAQANATSAEVASMMRDFRSAWIHMSAAQKSASRGAMTAKRTTKKVARKTKRMVSKK